MSRLRPVLVVCLAGLCLLSSCSNQPTPTRADLVKAFSKPTKTGDHLSAAQASCWADVTLRVLTKDELNQVVTDGGTKLTSARRAAWGKALAAC